MSTRILVPLDGSARAERAIPAAARRARRPGGAVSLARPVPLSAGISSPFAPSKTPYAFAEADLQIARDYLSASAKRADLDGIPTETKVAEAISVAPAHVEL